MTPVDDATDILAKWKPFFEDSNIALSDEAMSDLALCLHAQYRIAQRNQQNPTLNRCSIPAIMRAFMEDEAVFVGLVDTSECCEPLRLGRCDPPADPKDEAAWTVALKDRMIAAVQQVRKDDQPIYFGGLVVDHGGRLYLMVGC